MSSSDEGRRSDMQSIAQLQAELKDTRAQNAELQERLESERELRLELERAERTLHEQSARWLFAIEGTGIGVLDWDIDAGTMEFSDQWLAMTGHTDATLPQRIETLQSLVHPEDLPNAMADIEEVLAGRKAVHAIEHRLLHKEGHWIWVQARSLVTSWDEHHRPMRMIGTHVDITEKRRAEDALRESESRFRVLADGAPVVLFVDGPDGGVQFVNRTYCEYFGVTPQQAEGGKWRPLVHPDDSAHYLDSFMSAVREQVSFKGELRVRRADGQWREAEAIAEPRISPNGEYLGHVGIIVDLTERNLAEQERARLQAELVHAQRVESIGRLAGGVAHDFNNMLVAILGGVELALRQVESAAVRAHLLEVRTAAQRSAELTRQLLTFARKQPVVRRALNVNESLQSMFSMIRRLIDESIVLDWKPSHERWMVMMDEGQLSQLITNLCVNARDAINEVGKIAIWTQLSSFDETFCATHDEYLPGDYVQLTVSDSGCGMSQDALAHIFEPFYTTKQIYEGTGLGLATVSGIVEQNHGFIRVMSAPDTGTTFEIYLPRLAEE